MIRRNVANQSFLFGALYNTTSNTPETTGATVSVSKDLSSYAAGAGTLTHIADGVWEYRPTQAETDCAIFKAILTKSGAYAQCVTVLTTAADTQDSTSFGLSHLDAAVSTRSTLTASDVWSHTTRTLSSFGSLVSDIWAHGTRTLTSFGSLVSDIWTHGTRTLTGFGSLVSDVWSHVTRTLTSISDSSGVTTLLSRIPSALTITGGAVTVGTNNDKTGYSLAANAVNTTTLQDGTLTAAKFASGAITSTVLAANAIGASQIANGAITSAKFASGAIDAAAIANNAITDAKINAGALTAAKFASGAFDAVWSVGTRTLTDKAGFGLSSQALNDMASGVWNWSTRLLTAYSDSSGVTTLLSRIPSALTITGGAVTVGTNNDKTGYTLAANAVNTTTLQDGALTALKFASGAFDAVWSEPSVRSLTDKTGFTLAASALSDVASGVWTHSTRSLTQAVSGGGATAQEVWEYASRSLTDRDGFSLSPSGLADLLAAIQNMQIETGLSFIQLQRMLAAINLGISTGNTPEGGEVSFYSYDGTKIRVTAEIDEVGNRLVMLARDGT